ncbi:hypothetical protein DFH09DRAFT_1479851 [Mycena vulgaris]|nr:hypothetical protein DFH09DRAFT_1479851 [Mycena vulgaris]
MQRSILRLDTFSLALSASTTRSASPAPPALVLLTADCTRIPSLCPSAPTSPPPHLPPRNEDPPLLLPLSIPIPGALSSLHSYSLLKRRVFRPGGRLLAGIPSASDLARNDTLCFVLASVTNPHAARADTPAHSRSLRYPPPVTPQRRAQLVSTPAFATPGPAALRTRAEPVSTPPAPPRHSQRQSQRDPEPYALQGFAFAGRGFAGSRLRSRNPRLLLSLAAPARRLDSPPLRVCEASESRLPSNPSTSNWAAPVHPPSSALLAVHAPRTRIPLLFPFCYRRGLF